MGEGVIDKLKGHALDGFQLHPITLRPNNGMEITAYLNDNTCYVLRVDSRCGHVTVTWDGLACFDNGSFSQKKKP